MKSNLLSTHRLWIAALTFSQLSWAQLEKPLEPVQYVGTDKQANSDYLDGYHDGQLRPAIGVQNYQILRANRTHPEWSDGLGWTYNHAPMLAYWNNKFYCEYLSTPTGEHVPPGVTLLTTSKDGKNWSKPVVLFPIYYMVKENAEVAYTFMHQRMGFYVAPNGRLLTLAFYGGNNGDGIGRVVREIYSDGAFGPIYFIRPNDNWTADLLYPLYTASKDEGFVQACKDLLADKIRRLQWWEEDRFAKDKDEFYRIPWIKERGGVQPGKAFCFYTRDDGAVVGFFKNRWVTISQDEGDTWSEPIYCESLTYGGAKIWAQRLDNGQYVLVYNPANSPARHPLSIATGTDGIHFNHLVNVHGEVPPKRFWGNEKRPGPQYVRGIIEGNGHPPGDDLWVVYSVNKEDIWISRIPVPVRWEVDRGIADNFSAMQTGGIVTDWNIYSPKWCPVDVVDFPDNHEKSLRLKDQDPYDYAQVVRVFQKATRQSISFNIYIEANPQLLDIEVATAKGTRQIQIRIDQQGSLLVRNGERELSAVQALQRNIWYEMNIETNAKKAIFDLAIDGRTVAKTFNFSAKGEAPERIIFRTGEYRLADTVQEYKSGDPLKPGWDEPGADEPVQEAVYYIREFSAIPQ